MNTLPMRNRARGEVNKTKKKKEEEEKNCQKTHNGAAHGALQLKPVDFSPYSGAPELLQPLVTFPALPCTAALPFCNLSPTGQGGFSRLISYPQQVHTSHPYSDVG